MLNILVIGAHPDDCEVFAGGTAALWRRRGDRVRFVSFTNGNAGHHRIPKAELAALRRREATAAASLIGVEYEILENDDGCLEPTLERRLGTIRLIRQFAPQLILTHRPCDYHPDHRYTSLLVQDSAFMVTVPKICPDTPHLRLSPVIAYLHDDFRKPHPFSADVAVDVDLVMEVKWGLLDAHASQFYEWVPYNEGEISEVPSQPEARRKWLVAHWGPRLRAATESFRSRLLEVYGPQRGGKIQYAEAFEISEYGAHPSREDLLRLFPVAAGG